MKYKILLLIIIFLNIKLSAQQTQKPELHGKKWMAVTGKSLGATAGAMIFNKGGNAVDAACGMLAATCTLWDVLSWGGETQALIYNPKTKKVIAINALGVAPTGATVDFFKSRGYAFPPEYGPLAAVTPGTFGGLCYMLANYGTMSLKEVLAPAMDLAEGFPVDIPFARSVAKNKEKLAQWEYSKKLFITQEGNRLATPQPGEIFVQKDLLNTLKKLVETEQKALRQGKKRKEAIMAAYNRFYKGDIAKEFVRSVQAQGGLITEKDLADWKPIEEEPLHTTYKGIEVYKLNAWTQGPVLLQALNILENFDLKALKYNSADYIHTLYQTMNLVFADRDFYYGDPYFEPNIPIKGLLSKEYAKKQAEEIRNIKFNRSSEPGNPYLYEGKTNPYFHLLKLREFDQNFNNNRDFTPKHDIVFQNYSDDEYTDRLWRGTTTIEAADEEGWVVSVTPSGGWIPACIAGETGIGLSQRMQSFVLDSMLNPHNVVKPGKRPRVTLSPTIALKNGKPLLSFAVQGGDTQDQNQLQFFLNMVEFGMNVQQACEAENFNSNQLWLSLGGTKTEDRAPRTGEILLNVQTPDTVRSELIKKGYKIQVANRTSGPLNGIYFDEKFNTFWGGSSNYGEDYGIGW